jgi:hypothetical protein
MNGQLVQPRSAWIVGAIICVLAVSQAQITAPGKPKQSNQALASGRRTFESVSLTLLSIPRS